MTNKKNYEASSIANPYEPSRTTLHELLHLTGTEISFSTLPADATVPFVHAHQQNEEVYLVLQGSGVFFVDGEEFPVAAGSVVRVDPLGARSVKAGVTPLTYVCVQAKRGSLQQFTEKDGFPAEGTPSWS